MTAGITAGTAVATGVGALGTWAAVGQKLRNDHKKDKNHEQVPKLPVFSEITFKSDHARTLSSQRYNTPQPRHIKVAPSVVAG